MSTAPPLIRKAAVLGAGVMGAQIAAHLANAGIAVVLYDLPAKEGDANALVAKAIAGLAKLEPAPLGGKDRAAAIEAANYGSDLARLAQCDLVIEAIAERLDWKRDLYGRSRRILGRKRSSRRTRRGCHWPGCRRPCRSSCVRASAACIFFNPPRYMHLVELIAAPGTAPALLDGLETFLTTTLGKGVIRAKDTPNFIANRIGIFSVLATMHHAQAFGSVLTSWMR